MRQFIIIVATLSLISAANNLEYKDEDYEDDFEDPKGRDFKEYPEDSTLDDDEEVPEYNVKDAPQIFRGFVKSFNKKYKDQQDYAQHYRNFVSNLEYIIEHNKKNVASKLDINMFADLGDDEIKSFTG